MDPSPGRTRRVGLREIAQAAGVCLMTVSLSLRDNPKISAATRQRVRAIAARMGYRPDPEISRLMGRLRSSRLRRGTVVVGMIDLRDQPAAAVTPYDQAVRRGVTRRAEALGFSVSVFCVGD